MFDPPKAVQTIFSDGSEAKQQEVTSCGTATRISARNSVKTGTTPTDRSTRPGYTYHVNSIARSPTHCWHVPSLKKPASPLPNASLKPGHCERKPLHFEEKRSVTSPSVTTGGVSKQWFSLRTA